MNAFPRHRSWDFKPRLASPQGQAMLTSLIFLLFASLAVLFSLASLGLGETASVKSDANAEQSYFLAEAGIEDLSYRIKTGKQYSVAQTVPLDTLNASVSVTDGVNQKILTASGNVSGAIRNIQTNLQPGSGVSFHYGVQVGDAGLDLGKNSSISGDVFSNGDISGAGVGASTITGTAQSAGAHTIQSVNVNQNAYGANLLNCAVGGTAYYVSTFSKCTAPTTAVLTQPLAPLPFPISQTQIDSWKNDAAAGGVLDVYSVGNNNSATLGPKKINGNVTLGNGATLTLSGTLWVTGTINFGNTNIIKLASSYGANSGLLIVDDAVSFGNSATFQGSGQNGSYLMLISTYSGTGNAIDVGNSAQSSIFYAPNGNINIGNNLSLHEATGYGLDVGNGASITYESGLLNPNFTSGSTGGWNIRAWNEVP